MAASTDPLGVDLSALDTALDAASGTGSDQPTSATLGSLAADVRARSSTDTAESEQSESSLGSLADQLRAAESAPAEDVPAPPQGNPVPTPAPDSPNAQDQIHTSYGTVDAPRDGELSSTTVTSSGVELTANDLDGDGVVESVEVELADGSRVVYGDTDLDGSFDTVRYETADFETYQVESDTDGDGRIDTVITFDEDYTATVSTDIDGDGLADESYTADTSYSSDDGIADPI